MKRLLQIVVICSVLSARLAFGALALDGSAGSNSTGFSSAVTLTTTAAGVVTCALLMNSAGNITGITDDAGLTYTVRETNFSGGDHVETWSAISAGAHASNTITAVFNDSSGFTTMVCFGVSGTPASSVYDVNVSLPNKGNSDPRTVSTTAADTFIYGAFRMNGTPSPTAGTGFTTLYGANYFVVEYKIVSAPQTALSVPLATGAGDSNGAIADALVMATAAANVSTPARRHGQ